MQETEYFGETLNGQFFQIMGSDTRAMGRFVHVVRGLCWSRTTSTWPACLGFDCVNEALCEPKKNQKSVDITRP